MSAESTVVFEALLPKGNVTARTAYEVMPFENSLAIVIGLERGTNFRNSRSYIIAD